MFYQKLLVLYIERKCIASTGTRWRMLESDRAELSLGLAVDASVSYIGLGQLVERA